MTVYLRVQRVNTTPNVKTIAVYLTSSFGEKMSQNNPQILAQNFIQEGTVSVTSVTTLAE